MVDFPGEDRRSEARERALGLLYEAEAKSLTGRQVIETLPIVPDALAVEIVAGVDDHRDRLDEVIGRHAKGWTVARMAVLDRNVLRIAAFELFERPSVPTAVVLDEAVELAKAYGSTDESSRFVNGILSAVATEIRG
jgi:transcription antitermination protein NusB